MALREAGIDIATIVALWLGHEQIASVMPYIRADLGIKQRALDRPTLYRLPARPLPAPRQPARTFLASL